MTYAKRVLRCSGYVIGLMLTRFGELPDERRGQCCSGYVIGLMLTRHLDVPLAPHWRRGCSGYVIGLMLTLDGLDESTNHGRELQRLRDRFDADATSDCVLLARISKVAAAT